MFKIGDVVKCIRAEPGINLELNAIYTVFAICKSFPTLVSVTKDGYVYNDWADDRFVLHEPIDYLAITREFG